MIDQNHYDSVLINNKKLLKQNTFIHAQNLSLRKEMTEMERQHMSEILMITEKHDKHKDAAIKYIKKLGVYSSELKNIEILLDRIKVFNSES